MTETMKWTWVLTEPKKHKNLKAYEVEREFVELSSMSLGELLFHAIVSENVAAS